MAKNDRLKLNDFLSLWAFKCGSNKITEKTMRRYFNAFKSVILEQLKLNEEIYIYELGRFYLRPYGGDIRTMGDMKNKGKTIERFIKPRMVIAFDPSETLNRAVNEDNFEFVQKKTNRKYITPKEATEVRNERRRIPKKSFEDLFCEMTNDIENKRKED